MNKTSLAILAAGALLGSVLALPSTTAAPHAGAFYLPANVPLTQCTSLPTTSGDLVTIKVGGTWNAGPSGDLATVDAFYESFDGGVSWSLLRPGFGFLVDGANPTAPPFNPTHEYVLTMPGTGTAFCFSVGSGYYQDNVGGHDVVYVAGGSVEAVGGVIPGTGYGTETPEGAQVTPALYAPPVSTPPVGPQSVDTPGATVPPTPVPQVCAPLGVLCVGPFTVPGSTVPTIHVITTPTVPAIVITSGPTPVPPPTTVTNPVPVSVELSLGETTYSVEPNVGQTSTIGPIYTTIEDTPFGDIPVIVCAATCPVPVAPGAGVETSITVTATVGDIVVSRTVPLVLS